MTIGRIRTITSIPTPELIKHLIQYESDLGELTAPPRRQVRQPNDYSMEQIKRKEAFIEHAKHLQKCCQTIIFEYCKDVCHKSAGKVCNER